MCGNLNRLFLIIFLVFVTSSCEQKRTVKDLQKIIGQTITLPEGALRRVVDRDTSYTEGDGCKILIYYNAEGCTSCRLKELASWANMIDNVKDSIGVEFVFVFNTGKNMSDLEYNLRVYKFNHPVLCDINGEFEKNNVLPENNQLHSFLLDKNGKIILVGSPLGNKKMWALYKSKIEELTHIQ